MGFGTLSSIFVIALFFCPLTSQQVPQSNSDLFFLTEFFKKMGINSSTNFNFSAEMCSLQGVVCDASMEHVVNFVASGMGLSGVIPDNTIGKLAKLESLDLSNNKITGWPADLWNLGSLKKVNFSLNQISGSLSSNIVNFGGLESLDLSYNKFSGEIPASLTSLRSLQVLKLNENAFEGSIPSGILSCKFLVLIDLSSNRLSGALPHAFAAAFPKLKTLNVAGNEIEGRASDFTELKALTYLNISGNLFKGSVMDAFLGSLEVMDLSSNQFSGHISQVTSNSSFKWSSLVYLDLSDNELSGEIFHDLKNAQSLKGLNLAHNRFSRQTFPQVENLSSLEYLNLSEASITGRIPTEISQLSNLAVLDVSNNHLTGRIPHLSSKKLKIVDMSCNNLSGAIPSSIMAELRMMERFNFSYNNNLTFCSSELVNQTAEFQSAFIGSLSNCPIAANPNVFKSKHRNHKEIILALALTLSMLCLLVGLLCLAFSCRRRTTTWAVKQPSFNEEQNISGPFSFQTDSTTWVADVKQATSVPVIIFEKPLLNFTFADLLSATSHFDRGTLLAEGRFGPVYRGFLPGGIHVAVKVLVHGSTMTDQEAAKELGYLGRIKHPNLVPLTGYCMAGDQRIAIYDYMENGNLQNLLHDLPLGVQMTEDWSTDTWEEDENNGIQNVGSEGLLTTWRFRHKVALGTSRALAFLHHGCSPPIIHRDVKASSVYLDSNLEPRLSDFGLAKIFGNDMEEEISRGSPGYIPPEFYQEDNVSPKAQTPKSDVYGFGVVLFELVTGKKPVGDDYPEDKEGTLVSWVRGLVRNGVGSRAIDAKICGTASDAQMEEALKIGYLCTADLPMKRPTMQQIVGLLKDIEPVVNR